VDEPGALPGGPAQITAGNRTRTAAPTFEGRPQAAPNGLLLYAIDEERDADVRAPLTEIVTAQTG
jgi:hypothetical protein